MGAVTPAENYTENYTITNQSATGNVTKILGSTQRKKALIQPTQAGNNTSGTGVIKVTPSKGY